MSIRFKSKAMVLSPKKSVEHQLWVRSELLPQMVEFKYLWVLFMFEGRM